MSTRVFDPRSIGWRTFAWNGGSFDTARRPLTDSVEGTICTRSHLLLITLRGGAKRLEVSTDCGHRYSGMDRPGAVSFVPAFCERQLRLRGVCYEWASIALSPELIAHIGTEERGFTFDFAPFSIVDDPYIAAVAHELERLLTADGQLDPAYCEVMSHALGHYMARRYGQRAASSVPSAGKLPAWRLRRIENYVDAHIERPILVSELAQLVGVTAAHLHRAFRATTGITPLEYVTRKRIQRATSILATEHVSVPELTLRVGFASPSHFTRTFRRFTGVNPSAFRAGVPGIRRK